jgi:hypothetical protein
MPADSARADKWLSPFEKRLKYKGFGGVVALDGLAPGSLKPSRYL